MTKMTNNALSHDFYYNHDLNNFSDNMSKSQIDSMLLCNSYGTIVAARDNGIAAIEANSVSVTTGNHISLLKHACPTTYIQIEQLDSLIRSVKYGFNLSNTKKVDVVINHLIDNSDYIADSDMHKLLTLLNVKQSKNVSAKFMKAQEKEVKRLKKLATVKVNNYLDAKGDSFTELSRIKKQIKTYGIALNIKRAKMLKKLIADSRAASIEKRLDAEESQRLDFIDRIKAGKIHDLKVINELYPAAFWDRKLIKSIVDNNIELDLRMYDEYAFLDHEHLAQKSEAATCEFYNTYKSLPQLKRQYGVEFIRLLNDDTIITTLGVRIPLLEGKLLYKAYSKGKNIVGTTIGQYTVLEANNDMVKIGCHNFSAEGLRYFFNNIV